MRNTLASNSHPMGNFDKIQCRVGQIQMSIATPGGDIERAPIAVHVELQNTIGTVAQDNIDDRDMVMRGGPETLHRVHRRAISDQGHNGSVWIGKLHSQCSWQTLTNATAVIAKDAPWLLQRDRAQEITRGRDRLIKEHRMSWEAHTQGGHQACRSDGRTVPVLLDAAFLSLVFLLLLHGHSGSALRGLLLSRLRHTGDNDLSQLLQGELGISQEAEGGREIFAKAPRRIIHLDQGTPFW